jgi:hypothetical protein
MVQTLCRTMSKIVGTNQDTTNSPLVTADAGGRRLTSATIRFSSPGAEVLPHKRGLII